MGPATGPIGTRPGGLRAHDRAWVGDKLIGDPDERREAAELGMLKPDPDTVNPAEERRLPIFEAVESSWFSGSHRASGSARTAVKAGGNWSSPADEGWHAAQMVESPAAGSPTEAGLPRRLPNANLVPGAIPDSQPAVAPSRSAADVRDRLAGFQRGVTDGRAAASEAGKPAGENESLSVRSGRSVRLRTPPRA